MRIHQDAQLSADVGEYIIRISLGYLLHPLHFGVILCFLRRCRVYYLVVLLLQILQYVTYFPRCALDVLIKLTPRLDRSNSSISRSEKG